MIPKFRFKIILGIITMAEEVLELRKKYIASLDGNKDYEMIIREVPEWDVEAMRNYVHGPLTDFMIAMMKLKSGVAMSRPQMHKWLRDEFLPGTPKIVGGKTIPHPVSSESIGRKGYNFWIRNIDHWCQDTWQSQIPTDQEIISEHEVE